MPEFWWFFVAYAAVAGLAWALGWWMGYEAGSRRSR